MRLKFCDVAKVELVNLQHNDEQSFRVGFLKLF